jgi:hypothetical protein
MIRFKKFLKESGNAIKGLSRINQENVEKTLEEIYKKLLPKLKIKKSDTALLGSTGKKLPGGSSGDIDLAISLDSIMKNNNVVTFGNLLDIIIPKLKSLSSEIKDSRGLGIITIKWPISNTDGKQKNEFVQLDLMFVDSLKYSSWTFYSPHEKDSKYKGVYRVKMMSSILKNIDKKVIKTIVQEDEDIPVRWENYIMDLKAGVFKAIKDKQGKKGLLKKAKTVEKSFISNEPKTIVKLMLGPDFTLADANSFETLWKAIHSPKFAHKKNLKEIKEMIKKSFIEEGLPLPDEIDI